MITNASQSYFTISEKGLEYSPFDQSALLLYETNSDSISSCALECHALRVCRIFNYDGETNYCGLFEGEIGATGVMVTSGSFQSVYGSIELDSQDFVAYDLSCSFCQDSQFLTCINALCQCQFHTYFDGSICRSQKLEYGFCNNHVQCRQDLGLICQANMQCGCWYPIERIRFCYKRIVHFLFSDNANSNTTTVFSTNTSTSSAISNV